MLRFATASDVPDMLTIYGPYVEHTTVSFEYTVPTPEEFSRRLADITRQFPWLVYEQEGRVLGYAYASAPFARAAYGFCAEPSIYLSPQCQGRGIGTHLYTVLEELLRLQGYQRLYAIITEENTASLHFHSRFGYHDQAYFPRCGYKFGRWLGTYWMEKALPVVESPISFPVNWLSIVQNGEIPSDILASLSLS